MNNKPNTAKRDRPQSGAVPTILSQSGQHVCPIVRVEQLPKRGPKIAGRLLPQRLGTANPKHVLADELAVVVCFLDELLFDFVQLQQLVEQVVVILDECIEVALFRLQQFRHERFELLPLFCIGGRLERLDHQGGRLRGQLLRAVAELERRQFQLLNFILAGVDVPFQLAGVGQFFLLESEQRAHVHRAPRHRDPLAALLEIVFQRFQIVPWPNPVL